VQGTPTLRAFVPSRKPERKSKRAVEYSQAREVDDMARFALGQIPSYIRPVRDTAALDALLDEGFREKLPVVLVFSDSKGTSSVLKALSAEFVGPSAAGRRLLIGELKKSDEIAIAVDAYKVTKYPTLIGVKSGEEPLRLEKKKPSHFALDYFLTKVATKRKRATKEEL
jgi:hypothetical protein